MVSSDYETLEGKVDKVLEWANTRLDFDIEFVENLSEQLEASGTLTDRQEDALDTIIRKWRIE